jgi:hypothetical protein
MADLLQRQGEAVVGLRLGDFQHDGTQYVRRFQEKGGKSREIPVRHELEDFILAYVEAAGIAGDAKDSPLFRASNGRSRKLAAGPLGTVRICELVKRRLKDAGLPSRISAHSYRVTAITDLLTQGVPLEDVQYRGVSSHAPLLGGPCAYSSNSLYRSPSVLRSTPRRSQRRRRRRRSGHPESGSTGFDR